MYSSVEEHSPCLWKVLGSILSIVSLKIYVLHLPTATILPPPLIIKFLGSIPSIVSLEIYVLHLSTATILPPPLIINVKFLVWCHVSLRMMCTAGLELPSSWSIMAEGHVYLVWPLGKVKCFDTLSLPGVECVISHSIVDKWQTLEAARHSIAQWKSIHHVCERSWVWSPVLSL